VVNAQDFGDLDNQLDDIREKICGMYFVYSAYSMPYSSGDNIYRQAKNYERSIVHQGKRQSRPGGKSSGIHDDKM